MSDIVNEKTRAQGSFPGLLRIVVGILLLSLSLLNLFPAPVFLLWLGAIIVSEYAVYWVVISIILLLVGLGLKRFQKAGTYILFLAICLFSVPVFEAVIAAADFPVDFEYQFPKPANMIAGNIPLRYADLFKLGHETPLPYHSYVYGSAGRKDQSLDFYPPDLSAYANQLKSAYKLKAAYKVIKTTSGFKDDQVSVIRAADTDAYNSSVLRPCILIIHGGSWSGGNSQQLPDLNSVLAARGYAVASMNYRLAPEARSPAPLEDVKMALVYISAHASKLHIDTNNIVLLGRSAGAQIAMLAAYTLHNKNIKGVIDFYGPADMIWGYSKPANPLVLNSRKVMEDYLGGTYQQVPANYRLSSPIEFATVNSPPTLLLHGGNDALVAFEHSRRLNNKLHQLGVRHYLLALPWATHGFDYNLDGPGGQLSTYLVERFLASVCVNHAIK